MPDAASQIHNFQVYALANWTLRNKLGDAVRFALNPAQLRIEEAIAKFHAAGKPVRLRILKYRQAGVSLWASARLQHFVQTRHGMTVLSLADKYDLPAQWLRRCRGWHFETPEPLRPHAGATNANELYFDILQSRYYIGSAEGTTPGMGATIQAVHCSEVASWSKPDELLADLLPALPPGPNTYVIQESTGRAVGDWWYQRYYEAKSSESDYECLFLPWFIQPEYRDDPSEVLEIASDERALVAAGCDKGQLAWRRRMIRTEFHGDVSLFANQFPATEEEAFLSGGMSVYTAEQVSNARATVRKPIFVGDLLPRTNPVEYTIDSNPSGGLYQWEVPDHRFHYAIGADVQWGSKDTADFDGAYVECLETGRIVAALFGHWDMGRYACLLAALGFHYNEAILAPERNAQAATGVIAVLRGLAGNNWYYPNIWIRSDEVKMRGYRPEDYGWLTNEHTKAQMLAFAKEQTMLQQFDWCDVRAVDQMAAYIRDEKGKLTAPEGAHDDLLMARMITGIVAHRERSRTDLYVDPFDRPYTFVTPAQRVAEMLRDKPLEEVEEF